MHISKCLQCGEKLAGRAGKKFCDHHCKSQFHYQKAKKRRPTRYEEVKTCLKRNRAILKSYNKAGKSTVRAEELHREGFNPNYFTNYWKGKNGNLYLFCYEYGFMKLREGAKEKYVLVHWQPFMEG